MEWLLDNSTFLYFYAFHNSLSLVIALACGRDQHELYYAGMVGIVDPPRPGVTESIEVVRSAGVKVKMVTGDSLETACSVGKLRFHVLFEIVQLYSKPSTFK